MTPIEKIFGDFIRVFDRLSIPYAVMGGLAVRAHGIPRPTYDVDVTILIDRDELSTLYGEVVQFGYDVPQEYQTGWVDRVGGMPLVRATTFVEGRSLAIDIFLAETDFQRSLIARRIKELVNGFEAWLVSVEDLILLKLLAGRPRDMGDVQDVLTMNLNVDREYLDSWASSLGIGKLLEKLLEDAGLE